jgi:predicted TIM-barrel fold metal-dependent hydrolase
VYGLCSLSPHRKRNEYFSEVERCVKDLGFVGVKLHTIGHAVLPLTDDGMMVFEVGTELKIPVMVHTGMGLPFAQPSLCLPAARKYPHTKVVLAHAGFTFLSAEAQVIASECPNIYLETSWCTSNDIGWMIRTVGSDHVMLGSDLPSNISSELAKYRGLGLAPNSLEQVFRTTAQTVFELS